jgi:3-oxoacyl-[acyl-carrier protein] reductase
MDLGIRGRVAIVAAASRGIGYGAALELAREGVRVFLCSRDEERARLAAEQISKETAVEVVGVQADVTLDEDAKRFVSLVEEKAGRVDILVTNAGGPPAATFDTADLEMYRRAFELNALSAIRLAQLVVSGMRQRRWGRIVNITSISVKQPIMGLLLSNTVRAGLTGWAKTLSAEIAIDNVTVNSVAPGYTQTERQIELTEAKAKATGKTKEELMEMRAAEIPMHRSASVEEIAAAIAFLASERASYITGVTLQVDGGWVRSLY